MRARPPVRLSCFLANPFLATLTKFLAFSFSVSTYCSVYFVSILGRCPPSSLCFGFSFFLSFLLRCYSGACARPPEHSPLRVWVGRLFASPSQAKKPALEESKPGAYYMSCTTHEMRCRATEHKSQKGNLLSLTANSKKSEKGRTSTVQSTPQRRRSKTEDPTPDLGSR